MTATRTLVTFGRAGGRPPADDEAVTIAADGTFEAHRTLGGGRIGRFRGSLPAATLRALERDLDSVADAESFTVPTPRDGATETIAIGRRRGRLGSNERAPGAWAKPVRRLRDILRDVIVEHPLAVLELEAAPSGVRIVQRGTEALEVDLGAGSLRVTSFGPDDAVVDQRSGGLGGDAGTWTTAGPGWSADLATGSPPDGAARTQVIVFLRIRDAGGARDARLIAMLDHPAATSG